jgi:hypothetical protein
MRIFIVLLAAAWLGLAAPAAAQDPAGQARRLELAAQYLDLTQGETLRKSINAYFEETFAEAELPADQRDWLAQNMSVAFDRAMRATFADMTDNVAELFTEQELEAMIAFYDTPLGRSITEKSFQFGVQLETAMAPHLTEVFTQLGEKFCARFECPVGEEAESKLGLQP